MKIPRGMATVLGRETKGIAIFATLLAMALLVSIGAAQDLQSLSWGSLDFGQHKVGFRVAYEYDQSRTKRSKYDYKGRLIKENNARPVQIAIWYPSIPATDAEHMPYAEYEVTRATRFDYTRARKQILERYPDRFGSPGTDRELVRNLRNKILNRETTAFKDAPPARGPFPLILFCAGGGDAPDSHDLLFEFLASHGYIIAAVSSQGMFQDAPVYNLMDEESQVRDLEFTLAYMRDIPGVNTERICAMGYSYGGLINVLFALRNFDVNAVLSLDGSICLKDRDRHVKQLPYFRPTRLTAAFMNMARKPHSEQDFGFYNNLRYSDAYLLHFDTLSHAEFTSRPFVGDYSNLHSPENRNVTRVDTHQETICQYALQFLNAYLKDDERAIAFLAMNPQEHGVDRGTLWIESKKSLPWPPRDEHFFQLLDEEGVAAGIAAYERARDNEPGIVLFEESAMNRKAYSFLEEGRTEEAISLFKLNADMFPDSWNVYDSLAEAFLKNGQVDLAIENYEKSLAINPQNGNASRVLQSLVVH